MKSYNPLDECSFVGSVYGKHAREDFKEVMRQLFGLRTNNRKDWADQFRSKGMEFTAFLSKGGQTYTFKCEEYGPQEEMEGLLQVLATALEEKKVGYGIELYDGEDTLLDERIYRPTREEVAERERQRRLSRMRRRVWGAIVALLIAIPLALWAIPWTDSYTERCVICALDQHVANTPISVTRTEKPNSCSRWCDENLPHQHVWRRASDFITSNFFGSPMSAASRPMEPEWRLSPQQQLEVYERVPDADAVAELLVNINASDDSGTIRKAIFLLAGWLNNEEPDATGKINDLTWEQLRQQISRVLNER